MRIENTIINTITTHDGSYDMHFKQILQQHNVIYTTSNTYTYISGTRITFPIAITPDIILTTYTVRCVSDQTTINFNQIYNIIDNTNKTINISTTLFGDRAYFKTPNALIYDYNRVATKRYVDHTTYHVDKLYDDYSQYIGYSCNNTTGKVKSDSNYVCLCSSLVVGDTSTTGIGATGYGEENEISDIIAPTIRSQTKSIGAFTKGLLFRRHFIHIPSLSSQCTSN